MSEADAKLLRAIDAGDNAAAVAALDAGASARNVNAVTQCTPLQRACFRGHTAIAEMLIARGSPVNAAGIGGYTALHNAAATGAIGCIVALLRAGADSKARTTDGKTALDLAYARRQLNSTVILEGYNGSPSSLPTGPNAETAPKRMPGGTTMPANMRAVGRAVPTVARPAPATAVAAVDSSVLAVLAEMQAANAKLVATVQGLHAEVKALRPRVDEHGAAAARAEEHAAAAARSAADTAERLQAVAASNDRILHALQALPRTGAAAAAAHTEAAPNPVEGEPMWYLAPNPTE